MTDPAPLYQHLATAIDAQRRCKADAHAIKAGLPGALHASFLPLREEWAEKWEDAIHAMIERLPHGSGLDTEWRLDPDTGPNLIRLFIDYHHMDSNGFYCGWSTLTFTIKPHLIHEIDLRVTGTGRGNSDLADALHDMMTMALTEQYRMADFMPPPPPPRPPRRNPAMPEFVPQFSAPGIHPDPFVAAYLKAAEWTDCTGDNPECYESDGFSPEAIAAAEADCNDFREQCGLLLAAAFDNPTYTEEQAGIDFWLTRNRHGAGFWDRGLGKTIGDALTDIAHHMGDADLYCGDDGYLYFS